MEVLAGKTPSILHFQRVFEVQWLGWELVGVCSGKWLRPLTRLECLEPIFLSTQE